jgi:hypothetical protein
LVPSQLSFQFLALNQLKWRQRKVLEGKLRIKNSERLAFTQTRKSVEEIFLVFEVTNRSNQAAQKLS